MSDIIKLVVFPSNRKCFNYSPFCMKAEVYLRLTKTPYEIVTAVSPNSAPKRKLPFIIDGKEKVADSGQIIEYLRKKLNHDIDDWLTQEQHATGHAVRRMLEEHLYFCILYSRWVDDANWPEVKKEFFAGMPPVVRSVVPNIIRKGMRDSVYKQGVGRHSEEEIYAAASEDLLALRIILGDKKFLLGDKVSSYDATVFSFLSALIESNFGTDIEREAKHVAEFNNYIKRMRDMI